MGIPSYQVIGKFSKILWQSKDASILIVSFYIEKNDEKNPISLNKYGSISITFKDSSFSKLGLILNEESYEIVIVRNEASKYPDSYLIDLNNSKFNIIKKDESANNLNYLSRILKLPIFKNIVDSKINILIKELGEDLFERILNDSSIHGNLFGINQNDWSEFKSIIKNNYPFILDIKNLFRINVSFNAYKQLAKKFASLDAFLEEYKENIYQYYFDAEDDKKIRISDLNKIAQEFSKKSVAFKNATYLYYFLSEYFFSSGNTRIKKDLLKETLFKYTNDPNLIRIDEEFAKAKEFLIKKVYLVELEYEDSIYYTTRDIVYMEKYIVNRLVDLSKKNLNFNIEYKISSHFDSMQKEAISKSLEQKMVLITGNPGTGKTLIINEIISLLLNKYHPNDLAILTPTGRATININNKQQKIKAQTIHSFLQWDADENYFYISERNPMEVECLIIDEFSMVSLDLFYSLMKGIKSKSLKKIILVGDKDQLPAIGPGYLIKDFIETQMFQTIFLEKIYRQAENYEIIQDALKINEGIMPEFLGKNSQFISCDRKLLKQELIKKVQWLLKKGYSKKEIAILSPMYKYESGIDELNEELNAFFRKKEKQEIISYKERNLALGDKVINLVNDPKLKVFNGEIGYISKFIYGTSKSKKEQTLSHITVEFDFNEKDVTYKRSAFFENTYPAYCTSVHKYQGSETKAVIVVLFSEAKKLLSKKLIYTAITRAKQYSVIIGQKEALEFGIKNDSDSNRITNIKYLWNKKGGN
ncbi:Exodeoxyribonuclease V alpha chain [Metamycoplasma auris 15026]|uniref:Exodeoxyribonuclease V alpha chain n=1 Tax=Metamycoplasma auris 15026 TaxID=1188233 RepID=N9VC48_9BACT|nr:AAA family ATPase [Metamycoplasma auris]ENY69238.1 Exodeoxyribonuclease V alpha chain [Metamycoplasma auris 15026]